MRHFRLTSQLRGFDCLENPTVSICTCVILTILLRAKYYTEFDIEHQRIGFALAKERRVTLATELVDGGGDKDDEEEAEITAEIRDDIPKKVDSSREHHTSGQLVVVSVFGTIGVVILG